MPWTRWRLLPRHENGSSWQLVAYPQHAPRRGEQHCCIRTSMSTDTVVTTSTDTSTIAKATHALIFAWLADLSSSLLVSCLGVTVSCSLSSYFLLSLPFLSSLFLLSSREKALPFLFHPRPFFSFLFFSFLSACLASLVLAFRFLCSHFFCCFLPFSFCVGGAARGTQTYYLWVLVLILKLPVCTIY